MNASPSLVFLLLLLPDAAAAAPVAEAELPTSVEAGAWKVMARVGLGRRAAWAAAHPRKEPAERAVRDIDQAVALSPARGPILLFVSGTVAAAGTSPAAAGRSLFAELWLLGRESGRPRLAREVLDTQQVTRVEASVATRDPVRAARELLLVRRQKPDGYQVDLWRVEAQGKSFAPMNIVHHQAKTDMQVAFKACWPTPCRDLEIVVTRPLPADELARASLGRGTWEEYISFRPGQAGGGAWEATRWNRVAYGVPQDQVNALENKLLAVARPDVGIVRGTTQRAGAEVFVRGFATPLRFLDDGPTAKLTGPLLWVGDYVPAAKPGRLEYRGKLYVFDAAGTRVALEATLAHKFVETAVIDVGTWGKMFAVDTVSGEEPGKTRVVTRELWAPGSAGLQSLVKLETSRLGPQRCAGPEGCAQDSLKTEWSWSTTSHKGLPDLDVTGEETYDIMMRRQTRTHCELDGKRWACRKQIVAGE